MAPLSRIVAALLSCVLAAGPAAAQVKAVPEVAAPVGGGVAAAGTGALSAAPTLSVPSLAQPVLSVPGASPLPQVQAAPAVGSARAAVALPAAAVPNTAPRAQAAAAPSAPAAPVKGLEGLQKKTAEMGDLLKKEDGGAQAGVQAAGVASSIFDGGLRGPANGVLAEGAGTEGFGGSGSGSSSHFLQVLSANGVPSSTLGRLAGLLRDGHPGDQSRVYHGLSHSLRVANVAAAVVDGPAGRTLSPAQKNLLLVAAALHDYDPSREAGKPARVSATLETLAKDPDAAGLMRELSASGVSAAQVAALIKYTDFHPDAAQREQIRKDADARAEAAFPDPAGRAWAKLWGPRLAFVDQTAMYTDSPAYARQAVIGLANELGAPAEAVLSGTHNFLKPLVESPDFALLPGALQANFRAVHRYFVTLAAQAPAAPQAGPAQARAPPADQPVAALSRLQDALSTQARRDQASGDPKFYESALAVLSAQLKAWKASPRSAKARAGGTVSGLAKTQQEYKKALLDAARAFIAGRADGGAALKESDFITSGTSMESLLGILFSGGMEATNPYQGFSGESAHFWGAKGLEVGAGYGAQRGSHRDEPGVMLIIRSTDQKDPVRVVMGETLSRRPVVGKDIIAAVVTDGASTVVLQGPALAALAASSQRWKDHVVSEARKGRMAPFGAWERVQNRFDSTRR